MKKEDLEKTHPLYSDFIDEWRFYIRSYFGGKMYKEGNYLLQHPFESAANYRRRKETSYYYNYCGPIVDIFVSHLFRKGASRNYGSLCGDRLFESFVSDADLEGNTFPHFMREAQRLAGIYGRVSIMVDKSQVLTVSRAEAEDYVIRPDLTLVTPENLLDLVLKCLRRVPVMPLDEPDSVKKGISRLTAHFCPILETVVSPRAASSPLNSFLLLSSNSSLGMPGFVRGTKPTAADSFTPLAVSSPMARYILFTAI